MKGLFKKMNFNVTEGIMIPFIGTSLGALCVFFMKKNASGIVSRALVGFAAGVMTAASVWSLLLPAIEESENSVFPTFFPAFAGFWIGIIFLLILDKIIPYLHSKSKNAEIAESDLSGTAMLVLAVVLHNIPEGMAVGIVFAGVVQDSPGVTLAGAFALSVGIAIQNLPEGAIISMPLKSEGMSKTKSFVYGVLSGIVEPIFAFITVLFSELILPLFPYLLAFAAGAMIYVVAVELIPEMTQGERSDIGILAFALGFTLMMALDVSLG